jgi:UDP-glucose 4-epimerase
MNKQTILLTGGLGYIGSHIAIQILKLKKYKVIIIDNLLNTTIKKFDKIKEIIEPNDIEYINFYNCDLLNIDNLENIFFKNNINIVIHLAGLKSVSESVNKPCYYYENNIISTLNLIKIMERYNCKNLIFSSSATVYGNNKSPFNENMIIGSNITNPYGKSKYMQEEILSDLYKSDKSWNIILLRYFNPISHLHNNLKEEPTGIPNNLFPYLIKVHNKELDCLNIFGNDYDTVDGTCLRDFIHVSDLADGHILACEYMLNNSTCGKKIYNLGTGIPISVKQLIDSFENVNNVKINYKYTPRRNGDIDISYADISLAKNELNFKSKYTLYDMVKL